MLKPGVAPEEKARAEDQMNKIERELQGIQPKMDEVQRKYEDLQKEGQQAYAKMKDAKMGQQELQDAKNKVASAKRKLRSAEESVSTDTGEQKRKIKEEIKQNLKLTLSSLEYASAKYDEILRICCEIAGIDMNEEGKRQKRDNLV
jgi:chromosome segregation ATPase